VTHQDLKAIVAAAPTFAARHDIDVNTIVARWTAAIVPAQFNPGGDYSAILAAAPEFQSMHNIHARIVIGRWAREFLV